VAGVSAASSDIRITNVVAAERARQGWDALRRFSMAFFMPLYFAGVGIKLDLVHHFTAVFFIVFLLLACVAKSASVWAGARLAGRLGMPTSPDTLLGLIRAVPLAEPGQPRVVGVDEWAWRKGQCYSTLLAGGVPAREIGVIAPYRIQVALIRNELRDAGLAVTDGGLPQSHTLTIAAWVSLGQR